MNNNLINWSDFTKVELTAGTIVDVQDFAEARNPSYKIWVNFGEEIGTRKSSAQVTKLYTKEELIGKQIIGVTNFPPKQVGPFMSEFLVTGFVLEDGEVVLSTTDKKIPNGTRLY
ncbi:tRNA-binding protein [bacterium]|nr:tRNA-binding protein [bacterium]|tara:strand:+ start:3152 stop:3496 length:345 start_codon:yes stop_codon:yes gene_type:complete